MADVDGLRDENASLKAQLAELQSQREQERAEHDAKVANERSTAQTHAETAQQKASELEAMKKNMVRLTRQLDEEVTRRDQAHAETMMLERKVQDISMGEVSALPRPPSTAGGGRHKSSAGDGDHAARESGSQVSTKLMRVVDQWMRQRDLQQALLRNASINDQSFSTLVQALGDCVSLNTLDLSQNLLTMDSCSDICQLITSAPQLSFISLAENLFSLRSIGYFMTAIMERQNTKKLMPLDLLDLNGNEGLMAAAGAPAPEALVRQVSASLQKAHLKLPPSGVELVAQVMRALWRFLHDTGHPQVKDTTADEIAFHVMDKITLRKMDSALSKVLLLGADQDESYRPVTANLALFGHLENTSSSSYADDFAASPGQQVETPKASSGRQRPTPALSASRELPPAEGLSPARLSAAGQRQARPEASMRDPFSDLKAAFEPPKEKLKTFNLKQIVTRNGTVLMNMLERLLETTEIDAIDVETEQTLLEYACNTGNMGLAKLCYRRGAKLSARTRKGDTPFNIVTRNKRFDLMDFLHTYGVKVWSADKDGRTALHCAAANDDSDGICRLVEWGADVNIRDKKLRTPIHIAAAAGNMKATLLLLELGADMNAKDEKHFTAAGHANMHSHFVLFDRLAALGGTSHDSGGKQALMRSTSAKSVGQLVVSAGILKSSSLGRIGKVTVPGMTGAIRPTLTLEKR